MGNVLPPALWTTFSIQTKGKASKNHLAREIRVKNWTKYRQEHLVLSIKTSQFFEPALVDLVLNPYEEKPILLPLTVRPGCELSDEEVVVYALSQGRTEQCTAEETVRMRDHSLFSIAAEEKESDPVDFTKTFSRKFIIRNSSKVSLPPTATLVISGTTCFVAPIVVVGEILPGETKTVTLEHRLADENIDLKTIEEFTSYTLRHDRIVLKEYTRRARMYEYSGYLARYQPSGGASIRILVCGVFGSGKSSFIRSVCTALSPADLVLTNVAAVYPFGGHGTGTFGAFHCGAALPFVFLVDTWGKSDTNYTNGELLKMLNGVMQEGSHKDNPAYDEDAEGKHNKIHSVLLFVPAGSQGYECEKQMLQLAFTKHFEATILMSKCDLQLNANDMQRFRSNPNLPLENLEARKAQIAAALGTGAVLPVAPYVANETTKIFERDRLALIILEHALNAGKNYQTYHSSHN